MSATTQQFSGNGGCRLEIRRAGTPRYSDYERNLICKTFQKPHWYLQTNARDEEGLSSCFRASLPSCCRFNPARVNRHVSQSATIHAAFALRQSARPLGLRLFEATSAFTFVTARWLAPHPVDGFVDRFQRFGFPLLRYPSYEAPDFCLAGSVPHWTLQPFLDTLPDGRISQVRFEVLASRP